jgi:biotin carboxyl carrier protein
VQRLWDRGGQYDDVHAVFEELATAPAPQPAATRAAAHAPVPTRAAAPAPAPGPAPSSAADVAASLCAVAVMSDLPGSVLPAITAWAATVRSHADAGEKVRAGAACMRGRHPWVA